MALDKFGVPTTGSSATPALMPKLQYRFLVEFNNMLSSTVGTNGSTNILSQNVVSVSRPQLQHDEVVVDTYNSKIFLAGKHTWTPVSVTFRDDIASNVSRLVNEQMDRQLNHTLQSAPAVAQDYKFGVKIHTLTGDNTGTAELAILDTWQLWGCYLDNVNFNENAYNTSDSMTITISIKFDNATYSKTDVMPDNLLATG
jgi:hypothetical protein